MRSLHCCDAKRSSASARSRVGREIRDPDPDSGGGGVKVVLFCGGQGLRLRDAAPTIPKPMVTIGNRPVLWHIMRYYAHFGHKDFILCLGYNAVAIKEFFLHYNEAISNDFVLSGDGSVELLRSDISDWRITFLD